MISDVEKVLFTREDIALKVKEIAKQIDSDYQGKKPILIGILKGSALFMTDLMREMTVPCEIDFMKVSSYGSGSKTTGEIKILKDIDCAVNGRDIIIVEDILDTGVTLSSLIELFKTRNCASIRIASFLEKPARHKVDINLDYVGFVIDDVFIVGYGLDYAENYRNLPYIGVLKEELYK